jgi:hypothetical protein
MAALIRVINAIRAAFPDVTIIIVHHSGVAGGRPRGHSSLTGADDAQTAVERDKDGVITVTTEHTKDSAPGLPFACRYDNDGDPLTSCIIVPEKLAGAKGPKLTGAYKLAYDQLVDVLATNGSSAPASNHTFLRRLCGQAGHQAEGLCPGNAQAARASCCWHLGRFRLGAGHAGHRPDILKCPAKGSVAG